MSYHGFKYDEDHSYAPEGDFVFSRSYWCTTQSVTIGPIEYDLEEAKAVIVRREEFPIEVPRDLLKIREPGFRLWLSNRYLIAVLQSEHRSVTLVPDLGIITASSPTHTKALWANVRLGAGVLFALGGSFKERMI